MCRCDGLPWLCIAGAAFMLYEKAEIYKKPVKAPSSLALDTSKDPGAAPAFLGSLCQAQRGISL